MIRYKDYKDSGIVWLGEIPSHWEVKKLKYTTDLYTGNSLTDTQKDIYSTVELGYIYISTKDLSINTQKINYNTEMKIPIENLNFKVAQKNSTLICIEGGSAGKKIAYNDREDITFVNKLCCIKGNATTCNKFIYYYCNSNLFMEVFALYISGLIGGVSTTLLRNFIAIFPPLEEQEQIASYLDTKTKNIDELIQDKQNLIKLLKEQRIAIISETVTRGLNPSVVYKDSGIEWLGEIPSHWEVKKIKHVVKICNGKEIPEDINDGAIPVYGSGGIFKYTTIPIYNKPSVLLGRKGTIDIPILVNEPFWSVDTAFYTDIYTDKILVYLFYCISQILPFDYISTKTALPSMTQAALNNLKIPLAPLEEQEQIAQYLDTKTQEIDKCGMASLFNTKNLRASYLR